MKTGPVCRRPHQNLASVGVAALVQLVTAAGDQMDASTWIEIIQVGSPVLNVPSVSMDRVSLVRCGQKLPLD